MTSSFASAAAAMLVAAAVFMPWPQAQVRVLFIGNSLTAANDLPRMVAAIGRASGVEIDAAVMALPNFGLEEHWHDGRARNAIENGDWTHVVLQQGPTSLPESRRVLIENARRFAPIIRTARAHTVYYGVWPERGRPQAFSAVSAAYAAAAGETCGTVAPAGATWTEAWKADPSLAFYGEDGFHPSPLGTYAAAVTIAEAILGRPPSPARPRGLEKVSKAQFELIHRAASAAIAEYGRY